MNIDDDLDFRPKAQSPSELRELLGKYLREGTPCEILYDHNNEVCHVECFVASVHSDFVVLARIYQTSWINGWKALRLKSLIRVNPTEDADFIRRAMAANQISLPLPSPIDSGTFKDFLRSVCEKFPIILTDDDPTLLHPSAAGTILDVNSHSITIRAMSTKGFWERDPHTIHLKHITHVLFGSEYERTLERIAGLPDT